MVNHEELLAPIDGDLSAGPELRGSNEYAEIEGAFRAADEPVFLSPGEDLEGGGAGFDAVIDPAKDFLSTQSKDLSVAAYLTASLLRVEGFPGLADGLELVHGLLDRYWDGLHPGVESRAAVLEWMGSEDVSYAIALAPLTDFDPQHRLLEYKAWVKEQVKGGEDDEPGSEEGEGNGGDFGSGFAQTSREWYVELVAALKRCTVNLGAIVELGKQRFEEAGEKPPRLKAMAEALKTASKAADDLLFRKPGPPVQDPTESPGPSPVGEGAGSQSRGPGSGVLSEPTTAVEATNLILLGARFLRKDMPWHPGPYLLLRGLRWGELKAGGDHIDPRILEAPTTAQRTRLKRLFLDQEFEELLDASEELMATAVGRGWLDLQRYTVLSTERLGKDYRHVRNAVLKSTARLLIDVPGLLEMTLMDDSATASRDTTAWLEAEGLSPGQSSEEPCGGEPPSRDARSIIKEASFDRAATMARGGDPEGAIELLIDRAEHEPSERGRFITKAEAAGIMVNHGMRNVARPILDELLRVVEQHRLEDWEEADVVARPLGLLFTCLDDGEGQLKEQLYPRLAKLDPLLAMEVTGRKGHRERPKAAIAGSGPPELQVEPSEEVEDEGAGKLEGEEK